jgi:hypothetical protein
MPQLHIALQDGFGGEPVTILVDGKEVYRKDGVRTRTQIGMADSVQITCAAGPATIEVHAGKASATIAQTIAGDLHVGISLANGRITHRTSNQPFKYM